MPFYEYECQNCKYYTEVMQKITDAPLTKCPSCGKIALQKLISAPVFRLKGSGWYETDFKSDKEGRRNLAGDDDTGGSSESPSESRSAAKQAKPDEGKAGASESSDSGAGSSEAKSTEAKSSEPRSRPAPSVSTGKSASVARGKPTPKKAPAKSKPASKAVKKAPSKKPAKPPARKKSKR